MNIKSEYRCPIPVNKQKEIAAKYNSNLAQQRETNIKNNPNKKNIKNKPSTRNGKFIGRIKALIAAGIVLVGGVTAVATYKAHQANLTEIYSADIETDIKNEALEHAKENLTIDDLISDGQGFNVAVPSNRINEYNLLSNTDVDKELNDYFADPTDEAKSNLENRKKDIANLNFNLIKASLADSLDCTINDITITYTDTVLRIHSPKGYLEYWSDAGKHDDTQISSEDARTIRRIAEAYMEAKSEQSNLSIDEAIEHHANLKHILGEYNYTINDNKLCFQGIADGKLYKHSAGILGHSFTEIKEDKELELG